jgi:hypothetical protein
MVCGGTVQAKSSRVSGLFGRISAGVEEVAAIWAEPVQTAKNRLFRAAPSLHHQKFGEVLGCRSFW